MTNKEVEMGFFDGLCDVLSDAMTPTVSTPNTPHVYETPIGELKHDSDYFNVFFEAVHKFADSRPADSHLQRILHTASEICAEMFGDCNGHDAVWRIYFHGFDDKENSVKIILKAPNAIQMDCFGNPLQSRCGYKIWSGHERQEMEKLAAKEKRRQRPIIDSFLGIKFFAPLASVAEADVQPVDMENGLKIVPAKMNRFLSFSENCVFSAFDGDKVIGFMCITSKDTYKNEKEFEDYGNQIVSILKEKYQREFDYDKIEKKFTMNFYRDEVESKNLYATMELSVDDDGDMVLCLCDIDEAGKAIRRYEAKKRMIKDAKAATLRKDALDAL